MRFQRMPILPDAKSGTAAISNRLVTGCNGFHHLIRLCSYRRGWEDVGCQSCNHISCVSFLAGMERANGSTSAVLNMYVSASQARLWQAGLTSLAYSAVLGCALWCMALG